MNELDRRLRNLHRSYKQVGAEHDFSIWNSAKAQRLNTEIHAAFEDISVRQAALHRGVEELVSLLAVTVVHRVFPTETMKPNSPHAKQAQQAVQAMIREHHMETITRWRAQQSVTPQATLQQPPDALTDTGTDTGTDPSFAERMPDGAGTRIGPPSPPPPPPPPAKKNKKPPKTPGGSGNRLPKAFLITVPLGIILLFWPPNSKSVQIPGEIHFLVGLIIAALGFRRLRGPVIGIVLIIVVFIVVVTIWTNHMIAHH